MTTDTSALNPISTDAKILLNDWQALHEVIEKNTTPANDGLLSQHQVNDILQGPLQNFFKLKMAAYATIAKVRFMLIVTQDETFKSNKNTYPTEALKKISVADLDKMQKALDDQTHAHYQQWQDTINQWQQQIIMSLSAQDSNQLSDIEIKEFQDQEPYSELFARFVDLHIDIAQPATLDFEEYFRLKTHLTLHSSLSRRHQTHEAHEIHKHLKKLKKDFSAIKKDDEALLATQQQETNRIIESIIKIVGNLG